MSVQITQFRCKNLRTEVVRKAIDAYWAAETEALESVARGDGVARYQRDQFVFTTGGTS